MENLQLSKKAKIIFSAAVIALLLGIAAAIALSAVSVCQSREAMALIRESLTDDSGETRENDVTIMDTYKILSTENISDAYKSGDSSSLSDRDKKTLDMASAVLDEIISGEMTDYEKEKAVYDWMIKNINSDQSMLLVIPASDADSDDPYGVLKSKSAVCVGYATTFRLLMQMLDIDCMVVHNTERFHSWDLVKIDGNWYHTDVYSDKYAGGCVNFNMNDSMCSSEHDWDTSFFPAANSLEYNPIYMAAEKLTDIYAVPARVREALDNGGGTLGFVFEGLSGEQLSVLSALLEKTESAMWNSDEFCGYSFGINFSETDEGYFLAICCCDSNAQAETEISDAELEKIDDAINDAFGDLDYIYYGYDSADAGQ